jgi:K+ potassium transporter
VAKNSTENLSPASAIGAAGLSLSALGIVFGDIGTSPLYTLKAVLNLTAANPDAALIFREFSEHLTSRLAARVNLSQLLGRLRPLAQQPDAASTRCVSTRRAPQPWQETGAPTRVF